jgi:DNA (cytosine-5)-methyltransferase 1
MTRFREWDIERDAVDVLVGGTPCQSFSVAGLRKGLDDPRGNLALTFVAMVDHYRPEWVIWENVPGVLSSSGGRDFGSFLGALGQLGYGFAYRVLDAQYFGVPQRRRRVFVVAHSSGNSRRAAEVLFEPESLRGDSPKGRKTGQDTAQCLTTGTGCRYDPNTETLIPITFRKSRRAQSAEDFETWVPDDVTNTLNCFDLGDIRSVDIVVEPIALAENTIGRQPLNGGNGDGYTVGGPMYTLNATGVHGVAHTAHAFKIRGVGHYTGTNGGVAKPGTGGSGYMGQDEKAYTIATSQDQYVAHAFNHQSGGDMRGIDLREYPQLQAHQQTSVLHDMAVRRLTPTECERLQGFPDGYTDIMPETPDGPRYKALGNSMAVPVMRWIGSRIAIATK